MCRRLAASLPLAALLAACSPSEPPQPVAPRASVPADASLGSPAWNTWVDRSLGVSDGGQGPAPGSAEWNDAVQRKLGQEAPQSQPGSPAWQQAVDALLRTRGEGGA
jgi:hypothetical protein